MEESNYIKKKIKTKQTPNPAGQMRITAIHVCLTSEVHNLINLASVSYVLLSSISVTFNTPWFCTLLRSLSTDILDAQYISLVSPVSWELHDNLHHCRSFLWWLFILLNTAWPQFLPWYTHSCFFLCLQN